MTPEVLRGVLVVTLASFLFSYGMVSAMDRRTARRWRLRLANVTAWITGDRRRETDAYLRGIDEGVRIGRATAFRDVHARETELVARAYATGFNEGAQLAKAVRQ